MYPYGYPYNMVFQSPREGPTRPNTTTAQNTQMPLNYPIRSDFFENENIEAYGDSFNSEECSEPTKLILESGHSLIGIRPMNSSASENDSSRLHVFCLDHAHEVEQRLRSFGGVHMFFADDHYDDEDHDDHDYDDDDNNDNHQTVHVFPKMNVNQEKHLVVRTSTRKRKRIFKAMCMEVEASPPSRSPADSEDDSDFHPSESSKRRIRSKPARKLEVRTKSKPKMNQTQAKKGKKACVCAEDECAGQTFRSISDFNDHKRKTGHFKLFIKELTKKRGF